MKPQQEHNPSASIGPLFSSIFYTTTHYTILVTTFSFSYPKSNKETIFEEATKRQLTDIFIMLIPQLNFEINDLSIYRNNV